VAEASVAEASAAEEASAAWSPMACLRFCRRFSSRCCRACLRFSFSSWRFLIKSGSSLSGFRRVLRLIVKSVMLLVVHSPEAGALGKSLMLVPKLYYSSRRELLNRILQGNLLLDLTIRLEA
jgi:hypothetical protein